MPLFRKFVGIFKAAGVALRKRLLGAEPPVFVEDVFSTYLYTGNSTNRSIVNDIDLSGKGGLVWIKDRNAGLNHTLFDTVRGATNYLFSDSTNAQGTASNTLTAFNSNGFNLGTNSGYANGSGYTYVSWTFRKQPKFFDIVTFSGNGSNRTISHNLGSTPACIFVKCTSQDTGGWQVYHRSMTSAEYSMNLNGTGQQSSQPTVWNSTAPTSTVFSVGTAATVNQSGDTYVAYLFAHDAGGFGLTGTDNVISCGSYTGNGSASGPTISLGYEPQWVLVKRTDSTSSWTLSDNMRGQPVDGATAILFPNLADAEASATTAVSPTATGFQVKTSGATYNASGGTYIYIAIRRGPMAVPTSATSVFSPTTYLGNGSTQTIVNNLNVATGSLVWLKGRNNGNTHGLMDSLRGGSRKLSSDQDVAENAQGDISSFNNSGFSLNYVGGPGGSNAGGGDTFVSWTFRRAPGFFDEVCYTGNRAGRTLNHNLTVAPEMMIVKDRTVGEGWRVYHAALGASSFLVLETVAASAVDTNIWNNTAPTASVFSVGNYGPVNETGDNYVAYLFATCAGVSKVGNYTGTGTTLQVNCGFATGARFVMIKRTDDSGNWFVWDTARGIIAGNDPYLLLNSSAAEVTNTDYIDPYSPGFELSSTAPAALNASGGTYIFLAIA
jgi:hypothetical protein